MQRRWSLLALWLLAPFCLAAEELKVLLSSPPPGAPVFGEVLIGAEVNPPGSALVVEFYLDGEKIAVLETPPYRVSVDVGQQNREHRFEVRAYGLQGEVDSDLIVTPAVRIDERLDIELQELYVVVSDGDSRVLDLDQKDFLVLDNGREQDIVTFGRGDLPLASVIMVDASVSMKGRRLRFALRGAAVFAQATRPQDETSIQVFADHLLFASPFSGDFKALSAGLGQVEAGGGTALNDHLYRALHLVEARLGRRVVVFLSDGFDSHSVVGMSEVAWLARRSRAMLYWIRIDPPGRESRYSAWKGPRGYRDDYELLQKTVLDSGGRIVTLESFDETDSAVRTILAELREQYVLGYYPTSRRHDGRWHKVAVRVRRPGLTVRTRGGYIDY